MRACMVVILTVFMGCRAGTDPVEVDSGVSAPVCEAPPALGKNPVTRKGLLSIDADPDDPLQTGENFVMDLLEVELIGEGGFALGVGQGGLMVFETAGAAPTFRHRIVVSDGVAEVDRFHHLAYLGGEVAAVSNRSSGLYFLDIDDPLAEPLYLNRISGQSGLAAQDERLYVVSHDGWMHTWSVADPRAPVLMASSEGLDNAWEIVTDGGYAYVASNHLGVVPVDLADPDHPSVLEPVATDGSAQDLVAYEGALYVANGAAGIAVFDLAEPAAPRLVEALDHGGSVVSVAADDGVLWAVDHADVLAYDVSDPLAPVPIGSYPTEEWALAVDAHGGQALVGDWGNLGLYAAASEHPAPDARASVETLYFYEGEEELTLELLNRGGEALALHGAAVVPAEEDARFSVTLGEASVAPGESVSVAVRYEGGEGEAAELCLVTDDPDAPLVRVVLATTSDDGASLAVGEAAIDFVLPDVDGDYHRLSDHLGEPIYLVYFATW